MCENYRGPSDGGQTWPQIAQLPRSVFTGWAVKFGIGAQLLSETHPLSIAPQYSNAGQMSGMSLEKIELKTERLGGAGLSSSSIKISGSLRAVELAMPMVQSMLATAEETWSRAQAQLAGGARSSRSSDEDAADDTSDRCE